MKAFFKDTNKIVINSLDKDEALVGKTFLKELANSDIKIEQRYDVNDDFDGLIITLVERQEETEPETPTEETTETENTEEEDTNG